MRVIGTAGHVDHGKSTLVAALTGIHPDRLKEEQQREMTIELGFGWLRLPNGEEVGIVDVPGHRDFIENMLAGVGGIDAAVLVIAADEGVMPQTKEHLAILDLLQIPAGLVALTKVDLAPDAAWLDMVEGDIRATVAGTMLQEAPILRVSAKTGAGLEELIEALAGLLENEPRRPDLGRPRLPIDRVFTMSGFGTIVTGTLSDGALAISEEIEILPDGLRGRIRGLQTHKKKEEQALPGSRTAVNISGIAAEDIVRGDVLAHPGQYQAVRRLDARLRLLKEVSSPLKHAAEAKFFVGASEAMATVRVLGKEEILPGEEGWIQLELREPLVAVRGDRFILRRPSPGETLGGGMIVDHQPAGRHKRFDTQMLQALESLAQGSPAEVLLEAARAAGISSIKEIVTRSRLEAGAMAEALAELINTKQLILLEDGKPEATSDLLVAPALQWSALQEASLAAVRAYHEAFPLRRGIPREELKSRLKLTARTFNAAMKKMSAAGLLMQASSHISAPTHTIKLSPDERAKAEALREKFRASPYAPPSLKECQAETGEELMAALMDSGEFVAVSQDILFRKSDYDAMVAEIRAALEHNGEISLAEVRDLFNTSRKYAQALLEHLDATGLTVRAGDYRKLRK